MATQRPSEDQVEENERRRQQIRSLEGVSADERYFEDQTVWDDRALSDALRYGKLTGTTQDTIARVQAGRLERAKPATGLLPWQKVGVGIAGVGALAAIAKLFV